MQARKLSHLTSLFAMMLLLGACTLSSATPSATTQGGSPPAASPGGQQAATASSSPSVPLTPAPAPSAPAPGLFGFGTAATDTAIAKENIDVAPDGAGLPAGKGTPADGAKVYAAKCASCHGATGREGGIGPALVSEPGPYKPGTPRTIGSYWPHATTLYDYIYRAMPFDRPGSLQPDELYAVVAYLLNQNKVIVDSEEMNATTLPKVKMPSQDQFKPCWPVECRPDVP